MWYNLHSLVFSNYFYFLVTGALGEIRDSIILATQKSKNVGFTSSQNHVFFRSLFFSKQKILANPKNLAFPEK